MTTEQLCFCGHSKHQHYQHSDVVSGHFRDKRELCLECPGYEDPGYPRGKAWHRFKAA